MLRKMLLILLCLLLAACSGARKKGSGPSPDSVEPSGETKPAVARRSPQMTALLKLAEEEWTFFGRQVVVLDGEKESIPDVGHWEDDSDVYADRINRYWRSVGKPRLDGYDCKQPWSAAFISWLMDNAGVQDFPRSDAHWNYIRHYDQQGASGAFTVHPIKDYAPKPGDLICATRGNNGFTPLYDAMDTTSVLMGHSKLHCDLVVAAGEHWIEAIGGNVRNSVSKTRMSTLKGGRLGPTERRPWFVILESRF